VGLGLCEQHCGKQRAGIEEEGAAEEGRGVEVPSIRGSGTVALAMDEKAQGSVSFEGHILIQ
jgi:hypothetical protein